MVEQTLGGAGGLLTPTRVRQLLARHGLAPAKRLGQNFVVDGNTVRKVVRDAGVGPGDRVVEVGPGLGSLTLSLREVGAEVAAVEVDGGLVRALAEVVGDDPGVRVIHGDALHLDLGALFGPSGPGAPRPVLVANLPYNLATVLVLRALEAEAFDRLLVMVQREAGERMAAGVGHPRYGAVSVKVAALAEARVVGPVSRTAFFPVPGVDSVTVALRPRPWSGTVARPEVVALVDAGFAQRRKRLRNALAAAGHPPSAVEAALLTIGRDPGARAEELDLAGWTALAQALGR